MPGAAPLTVVFSRAVYAKTIADIPAVLGATDKPFPTTVDGLTEPLALLVRAVNVANFGSAAKYAEQPFSKECLGACNVSAEFPLTAGGRELLVQRTRRYHGGTVYAEWLTLVAADSRKLLGWVDFDLGGNPNFLATFDYTSNAFETVATTYDYDLNRLGEITFDAGAVAKVEELTKTITESTASLESNDVALLVCETNLGGALDPSLAAKTFLGPHRGSLGESDSSFFGWRRGAAGDVHGYLDAVVSTNFSMPSLDPFNVSHASQVAKLALGFDEAGTPTSGMRLLPLSAETCVFEPTVLQEVAERPDADQIRVVSLSATLPIDHAACVKLYPTGVNPHYLWVTASGNAGRVFTNLESSLNCPQSVTQRSNLLVVDGADGDQIMELADRGPRYSDIAADCRNESGTCTGTSLSAPRVAQSAAQIIQKHGPAISNEMVRTAILLSADVPSIPYDNRTGGVLNEENAFVMANRIVERDFGHRSSLSATEAQTLLEELYVGDSALVKNKLSILTTNGFFSD
jgi:hypothetical protein